MSWETHRVTNSYLETRNASEPSRSVSDQRIATTMKFAKTPYLKSSRSSAISPRWRKPSFPIDMPPTLRSHLPTGRPDRPAIAVSLPWPYAG